MEELIKALRLKKRQFAHLSSALGELERSVYEVGRERLALRNEMDALIAKLIDAQE